MTRRTRNIYMQDMLTLKCAWVRIFVLLIEALETVKWLLWKTIQIFIPIAHAHFESFSARCCEVTLVSQIVLIVMFVYLIMISIIIEQNLQSSKCSQVYKIKVFSMHLSRKYTRSSDHFPTGCLCKIFITFCCHQFYQAFIQQVYL